MFILNRIRGMYSWASWPIGILLGFIVYLIFGNAYVSLGVTFGYIALESMGWGEWLGRIGGSTKPLRPNDIEGDYNGIAWLASHFAERGTMLYNYVALAIRGAYWALGTLLALVWFIDLSAILLAVLCLALAFPFSVVVAKECQFYIKWLNVDDTWSRAEVIYGGIWDAVLLCLFFGALF